MRLIELSRYMHWRVIPRDLRFAIRSYLSFVWDCNEKVGETEAEVTRPRQRRREIRDASALLMLFIY